MAYGGLDESFELLCDPKDPKSDAFFRFIQQLLYQYRLNKVYEVREIITEAYVRGVRAIEAGTEIVAPLAWLKRTCFNVVREFRRELDKTFLAQAYLCESQPHYPFQTASVFLRYSFLRQAIRAIVVESMDLKKKSLQPVNCDNGGDDSDGIAPPDLYALASDRNIFVIVQEYCRLSKLIDPSEQDLTRLEAILELSQYDTELSCLINEADHLIAYDLELAEDIPLNTSSSFRSENSYYSKLALEIN